jgi:hypothetical protein
MAAALTRGTKNVAERFATSEPINAFRCIIEEAPKIKENKNKIA